MSEKTSVQPTRFDQLKPGDRIEVEHVVTVGQKSWTTTDRRRSRSHPSGAATACTIAATHDDKVFSDAILLELPDGELTSVTMDEFTVIRKA